MSRNDFSDHAVPLDLLRERAFNSRWAEQADGVIPLTAADPDFPVCPAIRDQLARYVRDGVFSYAPAAGLPQFRHAVADWMRRTRRIDCGPESVLATDSAASALAVVARASLEQGDEVLIPDPVDFLFAHTIQRCGGLPVRVGVGPGLDVQAFIDALTAALTPRTRMLWLCNPHNPLGLAYSRDWLSRVGQWALRHRLRIVCDEIWSDIVYAPNRHVSMASLAPEIAARTVTIHGFSKNFALAGLRVGCLVCTDDGWLRRIVAASDAESTVFGVSVLSQVAAVAALRDGQPWLQDFVEHLQSQRDYVLERLSRWPGVETCVPQATYLAFPCIVSLADDAEQLCERLRQDARVALVPGSARWFGPGAAGHLRICFATSRGILRSAFDRLEPVVAELAAQRAERHGGRPPPRR